MHIKDYLTKEYRPACTCSSVDEVHKNLTVKKMFINLYLTILMSWSFLILDSNAIKGIKSVFTVHSALQNKPTSTYKKLN